ncbi:hypothetical protein GW17_00060108 [Ensete ventricosum]|nr:hypothetical protein GW17_00060108 [Ensete ventricosum]
MGIGALASDEEEGKRRRHPPLSRSHEETPLRLVGRRTVPLKRITIPSLPLPLAPPALTPPTQISRRRAWQRLAATGFRNCIFYSHIMRVTLAVTQTILRWWSDLGVGGLELQCATLMATLKLEVKIWMFCPLIP